MTCDIKSARRKERDADFALDGPYVGTAAKMYVPPSSAAGGAAEAVGSALFIRGVRRPQASSASAGSMKSCRTGGAVEAAAATEASKSAALAGMAP